ncbi:MAG: hypothetical protein ABIF92_02620 [archaeon]
MYQFSIPLLVFILFVMAGLFAMRIRATGTVLSIIDMLSGLMIMGISGARSFTPFNWQLQVVNAVGVAVVVKGVYCFVLSRR